MCEFIDRYNVHGVYIDSSIPTDRRRSKKKKNETNENVHGNHKLVCINILTAFDLSSQLYRSTGIPLWEFFAAITTHSLTYGTSASRSRTFSVGF